MTIHWHIGWHNTGTTSIQRFLHTRRDALRECYGLIYPRAGLVDAGHHLLADAVSRRDLYGPRDRSRERDFLEATWEQLGRELADAGGDATVVLSSEGFRYAEPDKLVEMIRRAGLEADHRVVMYVRMPDLMLESLFVQEIKAGSWSGSFSAYAESRLAAGELDYQGVAQAWEGLAVGGPVRLVVRPFERGQWADRDLIADFLQAVDRPAAAGLPRLPRETANARPGRVMVSAAARVHRSIGRDRPLVGQGAVGAWLELAAERRARLPGGEQPALFMERASRERLRETFDPVFGGLGIDFQGRHRYPDGAADGLLDIGAMPPRQREELLLFGVECGLLSLDRLCAGMERERAEQARVAAELRSRKQVLREEEARLKVLKARRKKAGEGRRRSRWRRRLQRVLAWLKGRGGLAGPTGRDSGGDG